MSVVGVLVIVAIGILLNRDSVTKQEVSTDAPIDIVGDFYQDWLNAAQATSTDPYQEELHQNPLLSKQIRDNLKIAQKSQDGVDPVLCQTTVPMQTAMRIVHETEDKTEIVITARKSESTEQAIVKVLRLGEGWYIDSITCSPGEFAPDREFTFDTGGNLLKSVPPPYNPDYWHIVFEQNGIPGHAAPLLFDAQSMCRSEGEDNILCNPGTFEETARVHVQGEMTEAGIKVKFIEFKK